MTHDVPTTQVRTDNDNAAPLSPQFSSGSQGDVPATEIENVKLWRKRVKDAKNYWEPDFKRMRENSELAANIQWKGQEEMSDKEERYMCNFLTKHVNDKVASLYARDPKAEWERPPRLDFALWDGSVESEMQAQMAVAQAGMFGPTPQAAQAMMLLQDIQQGKAWQAMCEKVGKTLEYAYGYQLRVQSPSFKFQMKQLVRRIITCGVGYVRLNYVNESGHQLSSTLTDDSMAARMKRMKSIIAGIQDDQIQEDDPRIEQLQLLLQSQVYSVVNGDMTNVEERLEFDFPDATSIIIDPKCKSVKGFMGARWIAHQFLMSLDDANVYFELSGDKKITVGGEFVQYADDATELPRPTADSKPEDLQKKPLGMFWEIFDLDTKTNFFICDGWKTYVQAPQPCDPCLSRFWPIFGVTFNDIEVEPGQKVHVFPPSDVELLKPIQKERNRTRQELREHRMGNRPFHYGLAGTVNEEDEEKLANHKTHEYIRLKSCPTGPNGTQNVVDAIGHWTGTPIDQNLYNTQPLNEDEALVVGSNQVQQQMPIRHVAATPAVIQEQARISGVNSNVDDLDDLLSELAFAGGEMMLRKFSPQTMTRIVGRGAVFPDQQREDFLNEVNLTVVASSSGRPNKAVEVANFERIAPIIMQAIVNPLLWPIVEEGLKRLDDRLDVSKFLPNPMIQHMMMMQQLAQPQPSAGGAAGKKPQGGSQTHPPQPGGQPLQQLAGGGQGIPLPGHMQ